MDTATEKLLAPFRKLPLGYYRLFITGWIAIPIMITATYYSKRYIQTFDEVTFAIFLLCFLIYYILGRVIIWIYQGFEQTASIANTKTSSLIKKLRIPNNLTIKIISKSIDGFSTCTLRDGTTALIHDDIIKAKGWQGDFANGATHPEAKIYRAGDGLGRASFIVFDSPDFREDLPF